MFADALYLLLVVGTVIAMEAGADATLIRLLQLGQLATVWAIASSYGCIAVLVHIALTHGVNNPRMETAQRWLGGCRAVIGSWALFLCLGGVLLAAELDSPHTDSGLKTAVTHVIAALFLVLFLIPVAAMVVAVVTRSRTEEIQQIRRRLHFAQLTRTQLDALSGQLIRLSTTLTVFHLVPTVLVVVSTAGDECALRGSYRLVNIVFLAGQVMCTGRVLVDGVLDWMDGGSIWRTLDCE